MERKPFPSETQERFIVRFPDGMRDRIAEEAKKNNRSMNAEIVARLQASFVQYADAEFHSAGKPPQFAGGGPATGPGLPPALLAALERLFDEKLGQRAHIDDGKGGHMEDVKIVKKLKG